MTGHSAWPGAAAHADKRPFLQARAKILAAIRGWFADQGFIETDVGAIAPSPGAETHLHAFAVDGGYLHTSPEFAMKQLLAAGETKIYRLGAAYRAGDRGVLHAPEFTLLEWYRAGAPYEAVMDDCAALVACAAGAIGVDTLRWRDVAADAFAAPEKVTVACAFAARAGADVFAADAFAAFGREGDTWSDRFSQALVSRVEPHLGHGVMTLLTEYPIEEAALARPCPHDARVAERFELYACGVELANGYGELTDAAEQRRRFDAAMAEKQKRYGERWPAPEAFLDALAHMPPASGCALGVDRLVMLLTRARRIDDVLWSAPA